MQRKLWLGSISLFAGSGLLLALYGTRPPKPVADSPALQLRATDLGDRVRVEWNPMRDAVQRANGAMLEVNDGGHVARYPVDGNVLHSGKLDYLRHSDDVLLSLKVGDEGKTAVVGIVRAVRADTPPGAVPPVSASRETGQRARRPDRPRARRR